jgi:hypothetical protein
MHLVNSAHTVATTTTNTTTAIGQVVVKIDCGVLLPTAFGFETHRKRLDDNNMQCNILFFNHEMMIGTTKYRRREMSWKDPNSTSTNYCTVHTRLAIQSAIGL